MSKLKLNNEFDPQYTKAVKINGDIVRITCNNPSAFTFYGTNTYIIGTKNLGVIDPGPDDDEHLKTIIKTINGRKVSHILVTHTHCDHSPLARKLQELTKAPIFAYGPHQTAREMKVGESNPLEASSDYEFSPDVKVKHKEIIKGDEWELLALHTPGHTANHLAFAQVGHDYLFSGDQVMAWATSVVAAPDGSMADYMESLEVLLQQEQQTYLPGHGPVLENAHEFVRALRTHRKMRETAIIEQIKKGNGSISEIVAVLYKNVDARLHGAAALSVGAHIEDLIEKKKIEMVDNGFKATE